MISPNENLIKLKRVVTNDATERFNEALCESDWAEIKTCDNPPECYKLFFKKFRTIYENLFFKREDKIKG